MTPGTWTIRRFRCGVFAALGAGCLAAVPAQVVAAACAPELRLLRPDFSKYFTSPRQMSGVLDPDGNRRCPSEVELDNIALNDAERINGRLLEALHQFVNHRSAMYNRELVQGMPDETSSAAAGDAGPRHQQ